MPTFYECTSGIERILEAQGAFVCLPLGGEAVLADRSVGPGTWLMVALAGGIVLLVILCLARVIWQSYCPVLSPPFFHLFPLRILGGLGGSGGSNAGDQDQNLTAVSVVPRSGGTVIHRTVLPGPSVPFVPMPMGNTLVNPLYDPNYYGSDAVLAAPNTSTPLHAACCKDKMPGSILSLISSDAQSYKSVSDADAQSYKSALDADAQSYKSASGEDEATLVASPVILYHQHHGVIVDRASLGRSLVGSILSDLVEAVLDTITQPLVAEVMDTSTQPLNTSTQPLIAEAPTRRSRPSLPRKAKTKCRKALYQDPDNPYSRFSS